MSSALVGVSVSDEILAVVAMDVEEERSALGASAPSRVLTIAVNLYRQTLRRRLRNKGEWYTRPPNKYALHTINMINVAQRSASPSDS